MPYRGNKVTFDPSHDPGQWCDCGKNRPPDEPLASFEHIANLCWPHELVEIAGDLMAQTLGELGRKL